MAYFFSWNVPDISGVVLLELTEVPIVDPSSVWSGEPWPGKTPSAYLKTDVYKYLKKCNYWRMNSPSLVNYHRMYHRVKKYLSFPFLKAKIPAAPKLADSLKHQEGVQDFAAWILRLLSLRCYRHFPLHLHGK